MKNNTKASKLKKAAKAKKTGRDRSFGTISGGGGYSRAATAKDVQTKPRRKK